jgi:hypothetical protein
MPFFIAIEIEIRELGREKFRVPRVSFVVLARGGKERAGMA